ncbi:hypothetical protein O1611_g776 [Lasiodiplodia mahajangana]|uniref:Uncharacterized protein n=1 Tax=Lasiodiplodia mahajangana TaxID=1108764 RepID=A0ACC2JZA6_9PEZI|nr:hypothetical protein O1611_g776 [Lasiodiplodia mahajangana]
MMDRQHRRFRFRDIFHRKPKPDNSVFGPLPDDVLKMILRLSMQSDYPFPLDKACPLHWDKSCMLDMQRSPYARKKNESCVDEGARAYEMHADDWLLINSTYSRFRRLGRQIFFEEKVFILPTVALRQLYVKVTNSTLPTDLMEEDGKKIFNWKPYFKEKKTILNSPCRKPALQYIRHLYVVDPEHPSKRKTELWLRRWTELPTRLNIFPGLRRLTYCCLPNACAMEVLFMGNPSPLTTDNPQRLQLLVQEMQRLLVRYGMSEKVDLAWISSPRRRERTGE